MKSNPKNYTLPLIREGVTPFLKGVTNLEDIEKLTGVNLKQELEALD
jgi:hypothetical protein